MSKTILKIINILLILGVVGLGVWLIRQNIPPTGQMKIKAVAGQDKPMMTRLGPEPRVKIEGSEQTILASPVYFDLRSIHWFLQAKIILVYKEEGLKLEGIAGQTGAGWQYDVKQPNLVSKQDGGFKQAIFNFDLKTVFQQKMSGDF